MIRSHSSQRRKIVGVIVALVTAGVVLSWGISGKNPENVQARGMHMSVRPVGVVSSDSWQRIADVLIDVDATQEQRVDAVRSLFERRNEVGESLRSAVDAAIRDRDLKKSKDILYPKGTEARKLVDGLDAVRRQVVTDIIPEITKSGGRGLVPPQSSSAPSFNASKIISQLQEYQADPNKLKQDAQVEAKNNIRRTPTGLEMPTYSVLVQGDDYEIREYEPYTIAATPMTSSSDVGMSVAKSGNAFNTLAGYIFGNNQEKQAMSMTAPVEMTVGDKGASDMAFVLPSNFSDSSPAPMADDDITIKKVPGQILAVREFPGFATDMEIQRQKDFLLSSVSKDNDFVAPDQSSFRVLQWNPPYTLPWLRRNEICTKVLRVAEISETTEPDFEPEE
ncbi:hypothetical protein AAMO2058_001240300 [Amorphochlora amoebiformis]